MGDFSAVYKSREILRLSESAFYRFKTAGKVMEDDIVLTGSGLESLDVSYNGNRIISDEKIAGSWKLKTNGKMMDSDIEVMPIMISELENCLTFSSDSEFTINMYNNLKSWTGVVEWANSGNNWTEWDGYAVSSKDGILRFRGIENKSFTFGGRRWILTGSNISCKGNIETLLDYKTVLLGRHPEMYVSCFVYMFRDCTALVRAPSLPAVSLVDGCYFGMFRGCTSLETIPKLPATELKDECYMQMFSGCTNIKLSSTQNEIYKNAFRVPSAGDGTVASNSLTDMFANTGGEFKGTPTINTTYYTSNEII